MHVVLSEADRFERLILLGKSKCATITPSPHLNKFILLQWQDSNLRPFGYEPNELTTFPHCDIK